MQNYEKLGAFYLGKTYDMKEREVQDDLLLYDAKDLTTHAVCVGMTGSGKTGLCVSLLEEAAIDGIPTIAIDPKGDLGNLMLTFPSLQAKEFEPWIDPGEAARKGETVDGYATKVASLWKNGLASWGQDGSRIKRLRDAAEVSIYTPGSSAGRRLAVLRSFDAPPAAVLDDPELLRERVSTAVAGLLSLMGIDADPVQSREFILMSSIVEKAWSERQQPRPRWTHSRDSVTVHPACGRLRSRVFLPQRRTAARSRCGSTTCSLHQASPLGSRANRSIYSASCGRPKASRASRFSRSRTSLTPNACSS